MFVLFFKNFTRFISIKSYVREFCGETVHKWTTTRIIKPLFISKTTLRIRRITFLKYDFLLFDSPIRTQCEVLRRESFFYFSTVACLLLEIKRTEYLIVQYIYRYTRPSGFAGNLKYFIKKFRNFSRYTSTDIVFLRMANIRHCALCSRSGRSYINNSSKILYCFCIDCARARACACAVHELKIYEIRKLTLNSVRLKK